jgi:hypothetical protein
VDVIAKMADVVMVVRIERWLNRLERRVGFGVQEGGLYFDTPTDACTICQMGLLSIYGRS